jgi:hypothetical protein
LAEAFAVNIAHSRGYNANAFDFTGGFEEFIDFGVGGLPLGGFQLLLKLPDGLGLTVNRAGQIVFANVQDGRQSAERAQRQLVAGEGA